MDLETKSFIYATIVAFGIYLLMSNTTWPNNEITDVVEMEVTPSAPACILLNYEPREMIPSKKHFDWQRRYTQFLSDSYGREKEGMLHDVREWEQCWNGLTMKQIGDPTFGKSYMVNTIIFNNLGPAVGNSRLVSDEIVIGGMRNIARCTMSDADGRLYCALIDSSYDQILLGEFDTVRFKIHSTTTTKVGSEEEEAPTLVLHWLRDRPDDYAKQRKYMESFITNPAYFQNQTSPSSLEVYSE